MSLFNYILLQQDSIDLGSPSSASPRAERQLSNTSAFTEDSLNRCGSFKNFEDGYVSSDCRIYNRNYTREETGDLVTDSGSGEEEDAALALGGGDGGLPLSSSRDTSAPLGDTDNSLDNSDTETDINQVW